MTLDVEKLLFQADDLQDRNPDYQVIIVCTSRALSQELASRFTYSRYGLCLGGYHVIYACGPRNMSAFPAIIIPGDISVQPMFPLHIQVGDYVLMQGSVISVYRVSDCAETPTGRTHTITATGMAIQNGRERLVWDYDSGEACGIGTYITRRKSRSEQREMTNSDFEDLYPGFF